MCRCVFYIAWKLSETACIYTGFGFNGYNENGYATWDRVDNCDMVRIELAGNIRELVSVWNMQTAVWLKRDVYGRLTDLGFDKQTATTITFFISAFWHGVHIGKTFICKPSETIRVLLNRNCWSNTCMRYIGYYITFMSGSIVTIIARHIRRHIRPIFANEHSLWHWLKPVYDVTGIVTTQLTTVYIVIPFLVRDIWQCFLIYRALYFFVHVGMVVLYVAFETKLGRAGLAHMGISVNDPIKFETTSESGPVTDPVKTVRQKNCWWISKRLFKRLFSGLFNWLFKWLFSKLHINATRWDCIVLGSIDNVVWINHDGVNAWLICCEQCMPTRYSGGRLDIRLLHSCQHFVIYTFK